MMGIIKLGCMERFGLSDFYRKGARAQGIAKAIGFLIQNSVLG